MTGHRKRAASDVLQESLRASPFGLAHKQGSVIDGKDGDGTVNFFSRSGMNVIGLLLLLTIASVIYALWDVAIKRWFG